MLFNNQISNKLLEYAEKNNEKVYPAHPGFGVFFFFFLFFIFFPFIYFLLFKGDWKKVL